MCVCVCVCVCGCQCVEPGCVDCVYTDHREGPCHRDTATRVVLLVSACTPTIERARVTETQLHVLFCLCRRVHRPSRGPVSPRHSYTCCSACVGVYTGHREGPCHRDTATRVVVLLVSACTPTIERARVTETQLHVLSFCLCRRVHRPSRGPVSPRHSYTCCSACVGVYTDHREGPCHRDTATRVVVRLVSACTPTIERARVTETQLHVLSFGLCPDMYTENCLS